MQRTGTTSEWTRIDATRFWGQIAHTEHVLQVYASEEVFIEALTGFVGTGINSGDCVVVIATPGHLNALSEKLKSLGIHPSALVADERFIPMVADVILNRLLVNDQPDLDRLRELTDNLRRRAHQRGRKLRIFGEMVAVLWEEGRADIACALEDAWDEICHEGNMGVFCAYPEEVFGEHKAAGINKVCSCHSKLIAGSELQQQQVYYKHAATT